MRCIINVAIGTNHKREQQELLAPSLKKHFKGDFLHWNSFPNNNYDKSNPYNAKAAAFEEAIKEGYKQILWIDASVTAVKDVTPVFDRIKEDGYMLIKNYKYNCAQTCSDACLAYFKVTRDQAEKFQEYASGVIGVDMDNPKGKALIERFIEGCKAGACNGSRKHAGQSTDSRFPFHRQDQSVLSLAANTLGIPYTLEWGKDFFALNSNTVSSHTIFTWVGRDVPNTTRRARARARANTTLKANMGESFIYLCTRGGLNDCLVQLSQVLPYAQKDRRSILLRMQTYDATDLSSIFDFSKFPVPIYTNFQERLAAFPEVAFEPRVNPMKIGGGGPTVFNFQKTYPREKVLLYSKVSGGDGFSMLQYIRFTPEFLKEFRLHSESLHIPAEYISMHLRATDRALIINNNIRGISLAESNTIIKTPTSSKDPKKASLEKIDRFIKKFPGVAVFTASDNFNTLKYFKKKYPQTIMSETTFKYRSNSMENKSHIIHKKFGSKDENVLKEALFDLLLLAGGKAILTSAGGFSRLAKKLQVDKALLMDMLKN